MKHKKKYISLLLPVALLATAGVRAYAIPIKVACGDSSTGCEIKYGVPPCYPISWNYGKSAIASWACSGSTPSNYGCDIDWNGGCCNNVAPAVCPTAVCPCP